MKLLASLLVACVSALATPDCIAYFGSGGGVAFTTVGQVVTFSNNAKNCYDWRINYNSQGFTALSLIVESAADNAGSPGTWVTFTSPETTSNPVQGVNPNVNITGASSYFRGSPPWVRVRLASATGTGKISGILYGCQEPGCGSGMMASSGGPLPPGMWSIVQKAPVVAAASATSATSTFASTPAVGDVVLVGIVSSFYLTQNIVDNQAHTPASLNSYGLVVRQLNGTPQAMLFCAAVNSATGTYSVTANMTNPGFMSMFMIEYSGGSCKPDVTTFNSGSTSPYDCGTFTTGNTNDLLVSVFNNNANNTAITFTPSSGFTLELSQINGSCCQAGAYIDQVVNSTGTFDPQITSAPTALGVCVSAALHAANT